MYAQSCLTLCIPMDYRSPDSSVHRILQARILEWVALFCSRDLSDPGVEPTSLKSPELAGGLFVCLFLPIVPPEKPQRWPYSLPISS